ncbi:MAG: TonB-dependent receptor [Kordiimonas sp.]
MTMKKVMLSGVSKTSILLCASILAETVAAQDFEMEEIVVTASKRETSLLDLPQSIQAIGGGEIEDQALTAVEDITSLVPNLNLNASAKRGGGFNIRGIAALSEQFSQFATVGLYLDETPISDGFANFDVALFDLERVEVLKGPQGTLYGEGSLSGTVRLITKKPEMNIFSGKVLAGIETTKNGKVSYRANTALNLPIADDTAALRLTASHTRDGGFMNATSSADAAVAENVNDSRSTYLKAALALQVSDAFSLTPSFVYQKRSADSGVFDSIVLPDLTGFANGPNDIQETLQIYSLEAQYDFGWADLVSSTSYLKRKMASQDDDILTNAIVSAVFAPSAVTTQLFDRSIKTFTQELRLVSKGSERFDWLFGLFYRNREYNEQVNISNAVIGSLLGSPLTFAQDNRADYKQKAAFGEVNFHVSESFTLTAGARWFEEDISSRLDFGTLSLVTNSFETVLREPKIKEDNVLLKLAASYAPSESTTLYALFTQGVRPGGVNDRVLDILDRLSPAEEDALATFDSDSTNNYEVGLKTQLLDKRLRLNIAGFYIDWSDIQLDRDFQNIPGPVFTINAGKAKSIGAELELVAMPTDNFQVGVFMGYNDAKMAEDTSTSAGVIPKDAKLPFAPKFSRNIYGECTFSVGDGHTGTIRADWRHTGKRNAGVDVVDDPGFVLASYNTVDVRASVDFGAWSISAYAKNLTNTRAELDALLFGDGILGDALAGFVRNRPRTIGVQLQAEF